MHSQQIIAILLPTLSLLALSHTAPTQVTDITPRSCATEYPIISTIRKQTPDAPAYTGAQFSVWKNPDTPTWPPSPDGLTVDALLQFNNISADAWGCQLELFTPAGRPLLTSDIGGSHRMNIYRLSDPIVPGITTWNTAPEPAYLFGSTEVEVDGYAQEDTKIVINSVECESTLSFRVSIPPEVEKAGLWGFEENTGFRLTHNC